MLPGLDGTGRLFARLARALPPSMEPRIVRFPPDRLLGYRDLVRLATGQLPAKRPFALLAESFSGPLALRLASARPTGLAAVILVASFHRRPVSAGLAALAPLVHLLVTLPPPGFAIRRWLAGADAPVDLVDEVRAAIRSVRPAVLAGRIREAMSVDASDDLAASSLPLLYVGGAGDRLIRPGVVEEMRAARASLEIHEIDAPHLVAQRRPAELAAAVSAFLGRVAR